MVKTNFGYKLFHKNTCQVILFLKEAAGMETLIYGGALLKQKNSWRRVLGPILVPVSHHFGTRIGWAQGNSVIEFLLFTY